VQSLIMPKTKRPKLIRVVERQVEQPSPEVCSITIYQLAVLV
jgi:hypothetical protein